MAGVRGGGELRQEGAGWLWERGPRCIRRRRWQERLQAPTVSGPHSAQCARAATSLALAAAPCPNAPKAEAAGGWGMFPRRRFARGAAGRACAASHILGLLLWQQHRLVVSEARHGLAVGEAGRSHLVGDGVPLTAVVHLGGEGERGALSSAARGERMREGEARLRVGGASGVCAGGKRGRMDRSRAACTASPSLPFARACGIPKALTLASCPSMIRSSSEKLTRRTFSRMATLQGKPRSRGSST